MTDSSSALTMINGLLGSAMSRRDAALREIDRRRAEIIDPRGEAETIDGGTGEPVTLAPDAGVADGRA